MNEDPPTSASAAPGEQDRLPVWLRPRDAEAPLPRPKGPVPPPRRWKLLAFGTSTAAEFLVVTVAYAQTQFPGGWSMVGNLVFLLWIASLGYAVVLPTRPWLAEVRARTPRFLLPVLFGTALVIWLLGVDALQTVSAGASGPVLRVVPLLTPFGLMPAMEFLVGPVQGFLDLQLLLTFLVISYLWTVVVGLGVAAWRRRATCAPGERPTPSPGLRARAMGLLSWVPVLGLCSGCCSPPLIELAFLGLAPAAGPAFVGFRELNWIWDGCLELASVVLLVYLLHRTTRRETFAASTVHERQDEGRVSRAPTKVLEDDPSSVLRAPTDHGPTEGTPPRRGPADIEDLDGGRRGATPREAPS